MLLQNHCESRDWISTKLPKTWPQAEHLLPFWILLLLGHAVHAAKDCVIPGTDEAIGKQSGPCKKRQQRESSMSKYTSGADSLNNNMNKILLVGTVN